MSNAPAAFSALHIAKYAGRRLPFWWRFAIRRKGYSKEEKCAFRPGSKRFRC
jgi:hypothetical protein